MKDILPGLQDTSYLQDIVGNHNFVQNNPYGPQW